MSAIALSCSGGGNWSPWQQRDAVVPSGGASGSNISPAEFYGATLVMHAKASYAIDAVKRVGNVVRVAPRPTDPNAFAIDELFANATGGESRKVVPIQPRLAAVAAAQAAARVARLTEIQVALGTTLQALAEILRISRPQLYRWIDPNQIVRLQAESAARLERIEQLARRWSARSSSPLGGWLRERVGRERTLLDLLTAANLNIEEIDRVFEAIAQRVQNAPKSRAQRLREAGFTRPPTYRTLPSDE